MFQDEEQTSKRRRSSRIIALEVKRKKEKKNNELETKNNSSNQDNNINKGKRNETTDEGQHSDNGLTLRTNVPSQNGMPRKHTLEFVLDLLQRNDPEELFAKPVNPNVVEDCCSIVKQPMDFATMRAKLHEGMYTSMEHVKRDVYLMCTNAMNANPPNTRCYQVAEVINSYARRVFEDLNAPNPEHFQLESSVNKNTPASQGRKPRGGQPRTIGQARLRRKPAVEQKCWQLQRQPPPFC